MSSQEQADAAVASIICLKEAAEKYDVDYAELADLVMDNRVDPEDIKGTVEKVAFEMRAPFVPLDYTRPWTDDNS